MVNNEVAVGEDLKFQRKWWTFERAVWITFALIVLLDLLGVFGRGPLAKAHASNPDMQVTYERVERVGSPSIMRIRFAPSSIQNGKAQVWMSDSVVRELGNQRVIPQPVTSSLVDQGILYTFDSNERSDTIAFALQPTTPGLFHMSVGYPGKPPINLRIVVMP